MPEEIARRLNESTNEWETGLFEVGGGGGTGLPTGWTQDAADPANVDANGGNIDVGTLVASVAQAGFVQLGAPGTNAQLIVITTDPTTGGGHTADEGSLGLRTNGQLWLKTGAGDTAWTQLGAGAATSGVSAVDYLFTEVATAGVYTADTLNLPENCYLIDVQWWLTSSDDWAADTAVLDVVDSTVGGIINAQDVKTGTTGSPVSAAQAVILQNPYVFPNIDNTVEPSGGGTITTSITTTIAVPPVVPGAVMIVRLIYLAAPTPTDATFA